MGTVDMATVLWWTNQHDCALVRSLGIAARGGLTAGFSEDDGMPSWPGYIADAYSRRYGRAGRGRIWTAYGMKTSGVDPWPDSALAQLLGETHGAVLIWTRDVHHVVGLPGIVTDMALNLITAKDMIN